MPVTTSTLTPQEYLKRERTAERKSEYIDGTIRAMAGGTIEHSRLATNTVVALETRLRSTDCEAHGSDLRIEAAGAYYYPDASIFCGNPHVDIFDENTVTNPVLIVEVLSPSTQEIDLGEKWEHYRQIPSLRAYLVLWTTEQRIRLYSRSTASPLWIETNDTDSSGSILLPVVGKISFQELYAKSGIPRAAL